MSVKIQPTNLFVEAAYGQDGMLGLDGVTGQGESHDIAWKQALSDAASQLPASSLNAPIPTEQVNVGAMNGGQEQGAELAPYMGGQDNPVSWDRLSMTVASMVAWNMSVGMADDVLAKSIDPSPVSEPVPEEGILLSSEVLQDSDLALMDSSRDLVQPGFISAATLEEPLGRSEFGESDVGLQTAVEADTPDTKEFTAALDVAEMNQGSTPNKSVIFREGSEVNQSLEGMQSESTETREVGSKYPMDARLGTTTGNAANSIMKGLGSTPDTEIPPAYQTGRSGTSESTGSAEASDQAAGTMPNVTKAGQDPLDAILRVRSSSVVDPEVLAGKQRLAAIRQVLGQLENQAKLNEVVAEFRDTSRSAQQLQGAVLEGIDTKGSPQVIDAKSGTQPVSGAIPESQLNQNSGNTGADDDVEDGGTFGTVSEDGEPLDPESRPSLAKARPGGIGSARGTFRPQSKVALQAPIPQGDLSAAITGSENAEIASDELTLLEGIEFDAETIDTNEVPELAIQDPSQLDVDIDDAAGTVRLEMTRDGEEISIRMQTPQEVLDSYRDMEDEMGGALADQGLDLSQFAAEAYDPDGEEDHDGSDRANKEESRRGGSDTGTVGAQELEQTGATSRLVNHIV
jgi:hypothetical protein